MDSVTSLVAENPVVIFSRNSCCISHSIKSLIRGFGANPTVYKLDEMPDGREIEMALRQELELRPSVPAVFIGQWFVGGANQVINLHLKRMLVPLLMQAIATWI